MTHGTTADKPRVLLMIDMIQPTGGAERVAMQLALRIDPARFERTLCVSRWRPAAMSDPAVAAAKRELESAGVELLLIERGSRLALWTWWKLYSYLRRRPVDVVHAHKFGSNVWGTLIGSLARVPVVIAHEHMWSFEGGRLRRWLDRHLIARLSDRFITVSDQCGAAMVELERIDPAVVQVVKNGIPDIAPGDRGKLRAELELADDSPLIGAVAVLRHEKRVDVLVRAARELIEEFPQLKVVVAGDGAERAGTEALIRELDLQDVVLLLGVRYDIADVLAALDVAVLMSDFEGGSLALMEYMRAARPIVATRVGGNPELIDDGDTGLLVERGDPGALAEGIARQLRDPAAAKEMGRRARERQQRDFDVDRTVRSIEAIYDELLARLRVRARPLSAAVNGRAAIERLDSLESAREPWSQLADRTSNIFSTWEWADAWWHVYGGGNELELRACCGHDGELAAILPIYRMSQRMPRVLRYLGHGPADRLGPVCAPDDNEIAIEGLQRELDRLRATDIFLAERTRDGEMLAGLPGTVLRTDTNHVLEFDGSFDDYLASCSSNFRQQARRRERRLAASGQVRFRLADADSLEDDMTTLFHLHQARWGETQSSAFSESRRRFHRDFAARALDRGWLRLWLLELDDGPVAAWYGFRYADAEWYYQSGRDPAYDRQSVGFVLLLHTIRETLNDGLTQYHLLRGDEAYKARFANAAQPLVTLAVAARPLSWGLALGARSWARLSPDIKRRARRVFDTSV